MRSACLPVVLTIALLSAGCQGKPSPAAPTSPTVTSLTISSADTLLTGAAVSFAATVTRSDGTTQTVTPAWSSSSPDVATIDSAGRVDARAHGTTVVTATLEGVSATKAIAVVNNYAGLWTGRYVVTACDAPPTFCLAREYDFFSFPVDLEISQRGSDLREISATLHLANFQIHAPLSGLVTPDGRLNLAGRHDLTDPRGRIYATVHVGGWDTNLSGREMVGRWAQRLDNLNPSYTEILESRFESMTKVRSAAGR
ncbi:MAG TPA: Ig-like domain-containing protein [Vicinamibacterales bacterium]|nr:Ig-like domain-containing protein [Vicinamibacterales bacterium]